MGVTNRQGQSKTFLKIYSKEPGVDQKAAFFGKQQKVDGKWAVTERFNELSGRLTSVEHIVNTYNKEEVSVLRLIIQDGLDVFQVEGSFASLTYNIINCLASIESFNGELSITLYVNKSGYPTSYITMNGERVNWKYEASDIPQVKYVKVGNKEVADSSEREAFFVKAIDGIRSKLGAEPIEESNNKDIDFTIPGGDDDLPF